MLDFDAVIEWDAETGLYIGSIPGVHGAHTVAETLEELEVKLTEVLELCMEEIEESFHSKQSSIRSTSL